MEKGADAEEFPTDDESDEAIALRCINNEYATGCGQCSPDVSLSNVTVQ